MLGSTMIGRVGAPAAACTTRIPKSMWNVLPLPQPPRHCSVAIIPVGPPEFGCTVALEPLMSWFQTAVGGNAGSTAARAPGDNAHASVTNTIFFMMPPPVEGDGIIDSAPERGSCVPSHRS